MCGRFVVSYTYEELLRYLDEVYDVTDPVIDPTFPRYNVAPTQPVLAVLSDGKAYRAGMLQWGFVPSWAKDESIGQRMINARSETVLDKPAYRDSVRHKRCILLASGFYEWKKTPDVKQPYHITREDERLFAMAGLWSSYRKEDGSMRYTSTILTTSPNDVMQDIHERMPVILDEADAKVWLDHRTSTDSLIDLMRPFTRYPMKATPISSRVNNVRNEGIENIRPLT